MEYFERILKQNISFYDAEATSAGALSASLATDPNQLRDLIGPNFGFLFYFLLQIIAGCVLSFVVGWRLALVSIFSALPAVLLCGYAQVRFESFFAKLNEKTFDESAQFACEAVRNYRKMVSLRMENLIVDRYAGLLDRSINSALRKMPYAVVFFAITESLDLLASALILW
jgi:ATP-binding cassette subfamily B (MDR/TAP) protein 1